MRDCPFFPSDSVCTIGINIFSFIIWQFSGVARPLAARMLLDSLFNSTVYIFLCCAMCSFFQYKNKQTRMVAPVNFLSRRLGPLQQVPWCCLGSLTSSRPYSSRSHANTVTHSVPQFHASNFHFQADGYHNTIILWWLYNLNTLWVLARSSMLERTIYYRRCISLSIWLCSTRW